MTNEKANRVLAALVAKQHNCILKNNPEGALKALYQMYQIVQQTWSPNLKWTTEK